MGGEREHHDQEMPTDPRTRPDQAVDALEDKIHHDRCEEPGRVAADEAEHGTAAESAAESERPAFDQDIEPDQVSGDNGGHDGGEPPS